MFRFYCTASTIILSQSQLKQTRQIEIIDKMIKVQKLSTNCSRCNHKIAHTLNYLRILRVGAILVLCLVQLSLVRPVLGGINYNEFLAQLKVPQCRKDCLDKVSVWYDQRFLLLLFKPNLRHIIFKLTNTQFFFFSGQNKEQLQ